MSILTAPRARVNSGRHSAQAARTADEILSWVVAARQESKGSANPRVGITPDAWRRMTPVDRRAVGRRLAGLGCPRLGPGVTPFARFAAFIDRCVEGTALPEPSRSDLDLTAFAPAFVLIESEPRQSTAPDFAPTPEQAAEDLGFSLGFGGIEALPPDGLGADGRAAFLAGYARGVAALEAERDALLEALAAEHDRMEDAFGGPDATWHPAELAEAMAHAGHPAA